MFNICKCNLFHFLYANVVSLLLAKMTRISANRVEALATVVNNNAITGRNESTKNPDKFMYVRLITSILDR